MINLTFDVAPSKIHEDFNISLSPEEFVKFYAKEKSLDIASKNQNYLVIGADTIVVLDGKILGKPKDKKESFAMLKSLSDRTHSVFTGVSLNHINHQISRTFFEKTKVTFMNLSDSTISNYIETYRPFDKAGSYGIQDWFSVNVKKINGCFYNVMGFPLSAFFKHYKHIVNK